MLKLENLIAYKGAVTLEKAQWDNIAGMTVVFALEQRPHELTAANPFKKFTKMRAGKVGTRFDVAMFEVDDVESAIYDDQMMLKGWSDGTNGWKVTFWLQSDKHAHPFLHFEKDTVFGFCAIELEDDETPVDQVKREKVTTPRKQGLSNYAAMLCRAPEFWMYLRNEIKLESMYSGEYPPANAERLAKEWMCDLLNIESRAELDHKEDKIQNFHSKIRIPYAAFTGASYG